MGQHLVRDEKYFLDMYMLNAIYSGIILSLLKSGLVVSVGHV